MLKRVVLLTYVVRELNVIKITIGESQKLNNWNPTK